MAGKKRRALPGFGLSLGYALFYLSLLVLIPLGACIVKASSLSWTDFWRVVTDPMAGAMVVARVVMKQKGSAEEIIDHCARNLAPYKVPRRIEFVEAI